MGDPSVQNTSTLKGLFLSGDFRGGNLSERRI